MKQLTERKRPRGTGLPLALLVATWAGTATGSAQTTLAEFQFNEGTGNVTQSAVNNLTGTLGNAIAVDDVQLTADSPAGVAGDGAVKFAGGGYLLVDDSDAPILNLRTEPMTLEAWVKHDGTSARQYEGIMAYGSSYKLGLDTSQLIFTLFGIVDVYSGLTLTPDEWHHVAAAWEPGVGVTFYLDGATTFVPDANAMRAFANNFFAIGAEGLGTPILGTLDRVRVHRGLLAAEDLDSVANAPKPPLDATIVSYNFNESAMPFQNGKAPARPTFRGDEYANRGIAPAFAKDSPTGGDTDYCMNFDAAGKRVIVPDPNGVMRLDTGDFTIQTWAKFGPQAGRAVILWHNMAGGAFAFSVQDRRVHVTTLGYVDQISDAAIPDDGGWHHLAVVHENGKEFRFYVDGVLGDTVPYLQGVRIDERTETSFVIGCEVWGTLPFVGKLDRLMVTKGIVPADKLDFRPIPGVDPSAPELTIQTMVGVAWPGLPAGYKLQSTTDIADPNSWTDVTGTPFGVEGTFKYYAPVTPVKTFYRLIKP